MSKEKEIMSSHGILFWAFVIVLTSIMVSQPYSPSKPRPQPHCPEGTVLYNRSLYNDDICIPGAKPEYR